MATDTSELGYDPTDPDSIVSYAKRLEGKTLREMSDAPDLPDPHVRRGSFGNALEEYYFKYAINSDSAPDFADAGLELKATPMKKNANGELVAKERLVLSMIDFMSIPKESFESCHLLDKVSDMLVVSYLYEKDKNPVDYPIQFAERWQIPAADMPQIKKDYETVAAKVKAGHAEDISGSDTVYLEACTKAKDSTVRREQPFSPVPAKPRAWALKASYMTGVERELLNKSEAIRRNKGEESLGVLELIRKRFEPYFGKTQEELMAELDISKSKNAAARITNKALGIGKGMQAAELDKAGAKPKTIRLQKNGRPKEAISFPAFDYFELEQTPFEESDFYDQLEQLYLFVIYRENAEGDYVLSDVCFWQMPDADFDEAKRCYEQMQEYVRNGHADISVKSSENRCCHVRPHGRDNTDTKPQPHGVPVVKKCFWLNQAYLQEELARALGSQLV